MQGWPAAPPHWASNTDSMHEHHLLQLHARQERQQRAQTWLATLLSGICCAGMAYVINLGIEGIDKLRFMATLHLIHPGGGLLLPWLAFTGSSCAFCLLAGLGVAYLSPLAAGSGMPHIMAYCNGVDIPGLLVGFRLVGAAVERPIPMTRWFDCLFCEGGVRVGALRSGVSTSLWWAG